MTNPEDGDASRKADQDTPHQTTPHQTLPEQRHQAVLDRLNTIQNNADHAHTAMQHFMATVTRQLADPWAAVESLCINLRNETNDPTIKNRVISVGINQAVNDSNFEQIWSQSFDSMTPANRDRLFAMINSGHHAANRRPVQSPGGEAAPGPNQNVNRNGTGNPKQAQILQLQNSLIEKDTLIKELEAMAKQPQSQQIQKTIPNAQKRVLGPNSAQSANKNGGAESSSTAQRSATDQQLIPRSEGIRTDAEIAEMEQRRQYAGDLAAKESFQKTTGETRSAEYDHNALTAEEVDLISQMRLSQKARKQVKGKGKRKTDLSTENGASDVEIEDSFTPPPEHTKAVRDANPSSAKQTNANHLTTQAQQRRRPSQRHVDLKKKRKNTDTTPIEPKKTRWWVDPKTGKEHIGWIEAEDKPSKHSAPPPEDVQPPATNKTRSKPGARTSQATDAHETRDISELGQHSSSKEDTEDSDGLSEAVVKSDDDSSEAEIPEHAFDQSFPSHTNPGPTQEDREEDDDADDESIGSWQDGVEARNPSEAYIPSNRPKDIVKYYNSRQPTTAHDRRYGRPAFSTNDGMNREARPASSASAGQRRETKRPVPHAEADGKFHDFASSEKATLTHRQKSMTLHSRQGRGRSQTR
jgi:hypothetical protein